jgi:hypothetical protein
MIFSKGLVVPIDELKKLVLEHSEDLSHPQSEGIQGLHPSLLISQASLDVEVRVIIEGD